MKTHRKSRAAARSFRAFALAAALLTLSTMVEAQQSGIIGFIIQRDGQRIPASGASPIRWLPARKAYLIVDGNSRLEIPLRQVNTVRVAKPNQFDVIEKAVMAKRYAPAIPHLEKIMDDYSMLEWDIPAARMLTQAYMGMGQPAEAVKKAEVAINANPDAAWQDMNFARLYWQALAKTPGADTRLRSKLQQAIERGSRKTAAAAQVMRGNIDFDQGNFKGALVDGYLRTIMLFQDVKEVRPEALYRAVRTHERLGEHSHAEKFRKMLLSEYPQSSYSKDLRSGS